MQIAESMRRRVDEGRLELLRMQRLQQQKQQLVTQGEAVLAAHCAATWRLHRQPGAPRSSLDQEQQGGSITVHSVQAECAAGQWWLRAAISLPAHQARGCRPTILAASTVARLVCRQQHSTIVTSSSSGNDGSGSSGGMGPEGAGMQQLQLTAALDIQQHQEQPGEALWADVFVLLEHAAAASPTGVQAFSGRTAVAAPPVQLGRVQLSWAEWLTSHSRPAALVSEQPQEQHGIVLAVASQQLDLQCLSHITQQRLACTRVAAPAAAGRSQLAFVLRGPPSPAAAMSSVPGDVSLATVGITQHSRQFAEVHLEASNALMLGVLQQQLSEGLRQAAREAGLPPDDAAVQRSLLSPRHAQQQAVAAEALVQELDASIAWVETLLKQKLALDSRQRRHKVAAPSDAEVLQKQAAALTAMAATDECMVSLLTS